MTGRKVRAYVYADAKGRPRLRKIRKEPKAQLKKPFCMESWTGRFWVPGIRDEQVAFAEEAMYHLEELLWALSQNRPVYWCEGEKDADVIRAVGGGNVAGTTGWQGASKVTADQAAWFRRGTGRIYIVVDVDRAGAFSGVTRWDLLLQAGVAKSRLRIVAAPRPHNDVADAHATGALDGRLRACGLRKVDLPRLKAAAASYASERVARKGSGKDSDWMRR